MPSAFYDKLVQDLDTTRKIAYRVPALECNTVIQELKIKSLILLSHAVIEEYLEGISLDIAESAVKKYSDEGKICRALVGLITAGLIGKVEEAGLKKKIKKEPFENIGLFSSAAYGRFKSLVDNNNGIKKDNQEKLLLPIGIDPEVEDPVTMAVLDSFGGKRGAVAHKFKIAKNHTLSEIEVDLDTIKAGLVGLDEACYACLN